MTRQLTASLESGDALLSIAVPVREENGILVESGDSTYTVDQIEVTECELVRTFGQTVLEELTDRVWDDGTLTEEWDGLHD